LYERQRALVRGGLLELSDGRGPGSGVRADTRGIALLIIAVLATDSLSETEKRVREIADAEPVGGTQYLAITFLDHLEDFLLSEVVHEISVSRTAARACITVEDQDNSETIYFLGEQSVEPGLRVEATLAFEPFRQIAADVRAMLADELIERKQRG
jgi:hypothetical protein